MDIPERFYLVGDEDCGVGLCCSDCWDGGRPLAYYTRSTTESYDAYINDPLVTNVNTIADLLACGQRHQQQSHTPDRRTTS